MHSHNQWSPSARVFLLALLFLLAVAYSSFGLDRRVVQPASSLDTNRNRIADRLETLISNGKYIPRFQEHRRRSDCCP